MAENEGLSAEAIARTVAETMYRKDMASSSIGITPKEICPGHAVMTLRITEAMLNSHGMCHGGYIFMLADSTFAYACNSYNQNTVAAAAQINFLRPVVLNELLTATATEISKTGRTGLYDVVVKNEAEETVACFRGNAHTIKGQMIPGLSERDEQ